MKAVFATLILACLAVMPAAHATDTVVKKQAAKPADSAVIVKGIGVVDVIALMRESKAAKSIEKQLNDRRKLYRDQLAAQEKKLQAAEDEFVKNRKALKPEEVDAKRKSFDKSVRELQQSAQKKRIAFDKAATSAVAKLQAKITEITATVAQEKKLQLVFTRDQVVVVEQSLDITGEVLTRLNKELPSVSITTDEKKK